MRLDLRRRQGIGARLGCDLTFDYVKINAEYYTGPAAPGGGGQAPPIGTNRPLVVEALSYIRKFGGKRVRHQVRRRGDGRPALKRSFAEEVVLLQSAGLKPVDRPRRRPGDHEDAGEAGGEVGVRPTGSASPARKRSRWSRWC